MLLIILGGASQLGAIYCRPDPSSRPVYCRPDPCSWLVYSRPGPTIFQAQWAPTAGLTLCGCRLHAACCKGVRIGHGHLKSGNPPCLRHHHSEDKTESLQRTLVDVIFEITKAGSEKLKLSNIALIVIVKAEQASSWSSSLSL